ncbi:PIR protein CIR protein [Plasmodium vinckei lentum]|uniref:PIR protein CIR protein n=1 Tax=Plasmodium vinckei lentum TaxID=138297 RepID=A0A6V7S835_PLAVN|nr:PIR protein CIR protein [Plasmodium vinckei lentum]
MSEGVCKIFLKIDILFKDGKPDLEEVNKFDKYRRYCPIDRTGIKICANDIEGTAALYSRLLDDLFQRPQNAQKRENNDDQYIEYILIWLGNILFQRESYTSSTLIDFYNNHLKNDHLPFNYNYMIERKNDLLNANIEYMRRFYLLFNEICYITLKYPKVNPNVIEIKKDSTNFYNKYASLYRDINECESYLKLLNNLETIYENLKRSLIKNRQNRLLKGILNVNFKSLPPTKKANKKSTIGFECPKCKKINSKAEEKKRKSVPKVSKPVDSISSPTAPPLPPQQAQSTPVPAPPEKPKEGRTSQQGEQKPPEPSPPLTTEIQKGSPDSQGSPNAKVGQLSNQKDTSKGSDSDQHNTANEIGRQGDGIVHKSEQSQDGQQQILNPKQGNSDGSENSDQKPSTNEPEKQPPQSETKEPSPSEISQQTQLHSAQPEPQDIPESKKPQKEGPSHPNGQDASKIDPKVSGSENGNPNDGANGSGAPSGGAGDPPSGPDAPGQGGKSDITNPPDQAGTSNTSERSIDLKSSFLGVLLNTTENFHKAFQFIEKNQQKVKDATDKISSVYNSAVDNLKSTYNAYRSYFSDIINNITIQLNQDDTPSKLGNSGNIPQNSDKSQKNGDTSLPPTKDPPEKDPQPNSPSTSPIDPAQQKQSSLQSHPITPKTPQVDTLNHKTTDKANSQLVKSLSSDPILKKSWSIFPTTWNGSEDCRPKINFMNTTLVCCTSEQCSITGISVILVLIPIILLIMYKYLSSGRKREMKRKKNMKKVINSIGGTRPVQIIINAPSQKKKTKKSINPVYREKSSLLNIYKLMQADPVPFINLFFLLIFFVYKRKLNSLEL